MKFVTIFLFSLFPIFILAQEPTLVSDFRPGNDDGFDDFNYHGAKLNDRYLLPVISDEFGSELGVIEDETVSLLLDINIGAEGSTPMEFVRFKDQVYFTAVDNINGGGIWSTDGTPEGTKKIFDPENAGNERPRGLIGNPWLEHLYFTYDGVLYRTDGTEVKEIYQNVDFEIDWTTKGRTYASYVYGEIAFLTENEDKVQLMAVIQDSVHMLGETPETSGFYDIHELCGTSGGLMFGLSDRFDDEISGVYYYDISEKSLERWKLYDEEIEPRRMYVANDTFALIWEKDLGFYLASGIESQLQEVLLTDDAEIFQGGKLNFVVHGGNLLLFVDEGSFGDSKMYFYKIFDSGRTLLEVGSHTSPIINENSTAFFATNISNGFEPELYSVDLRSGSVDTVFFFTERALESDAVLPLTVVGTKLYFLSNLDQEIGRELYYIDLGETTSTTEIANEVSFGVRFAGESFVVDSEHLSPISISVYNTAGVLLQSYESQPGLYHKAPNTADGILILKVHQHKWSSSYIWPITR